MSGPPDHIISVAEIFQMKGFLELTPAQMWLVTNTPVNLQWLSGKANLSKQSRSAADIRGADPAWVADQVALEQKTRPRLLDLIQQLLKSQPSEGKVGR